MPLKLPLKTYSIYALLKNRKPWVYWIPSAALFGFYLYKSLSFPPHDFSNYYFPSYFLLKGDFGNWIFDPYSFNRNIFEEGFKNIYASFNPNPPFTAIFYIPFALLPLGLSKLLFNIVSILLFVVSIHRLCIYIKADTKILLAFLPIIFFISFKNQILFGQTYFLLFFLLAEGFMAYDQKRNFAFTIFWTLAIFLKIFPAIVFLFLALRKDWKSVIWLASGCLIVLTGSILVQGLSVWKEYLLYILPANNNGQISAAYTVNYQSAFMLAKYLFVKDEVLNANPLLDSYAAFSAALIIFKSIVLAACISVAIQRRDLISFGVLMIGALLISPYGSTYGNLILLIPILGMLNVLPWQKTAFICFIVFVISNLPLKYFNNLPEALQFPRLYLTTGLLLLIFIFLKISLSVKAGLVSFVLFTLLTSSKQHQKQIGTDRHFLLAEDHLLIINHGTKDGRLFYDYWNVHGKNSVITNYPVNSYDTASVIVNQNQICYKGTQLTFSDDKKMIPAVINDSVIMYLSDKGKGRGFYTLRVLPIDN